MPTKVHLISEVLQYVLVFGTLEWVLIFQEEGFQLLVPWGFSSPIGGGSSSSQSTTSSSVKITIWHSRSPCCNTSKKKLQIINRILFAKQRNVLIQTSSLHRLYLMQIIYMHLSMKNVRHDQSPKWKNLTRDFAPTKMNNMATLCSMN